MVTASNLADFTQVMSREGDFFPSGKTFIIKKEKGTLHFYRRDGAHLWYEINTGRHGIENSRTRDRVKFFENTRCWRSSYSHILSDRNKVSIVDDIKDMQDDSGSGYGDFMLDVIGIINNQVTEFGKPRRVQNLGNVLPYLKTYEDMNHWNQLGIKCLVPCKSPSKIPRDVRRIMKDEYIVIGTSQARAMRDPDWFSFMVRVAHNERISTTYHDVFFDVVQFWNWFFGASDDIKEMVQTYGFELKALLRYVHNYIIPYEGVTHPFTLIRDHYHMQYVMGLDNIDKYPKYLRSKHDIVTREFNKFKKEYSDEVFNQMTNKELAYECDRFCVEVPEKTEDVYHEGRSLGHCVASYVDRIIKGSTQIVFLRRRYGEPMITVEVRDGLVLQARGYGNRDISKPEKKLLMEYAKAKNLPVHL